MKSNGKSSLMFDFILALLVIALGYFIYEMFLKKKFRNVHARPQTSVSHSMEQKPKEIYSLGYDAFLKRISDISDSDWKNLLSLPEVKSSIASKSSGCFRNNFKVATRYSVDLELLQRYKSGINQTSLDISGARCLILGQDLNLGLYSNRPLDPMFTPIAEVKIVGLLNFTYSDLPEPVIRILGFTKKELDSFVLNEKRSSQTQFTVIRMGQIREPIFENDKPWHGYLRYSVIGTNELIKLLVEKKSPILNRSFEDFVVIDVRSEREFFRNPISGTINVPFNLVSSKGSQIMDYSWTIKVGELEKADFDLGRLNQTIKGGKIPIIVGNSPKDGRPVWALRAALEDGLETALWYFDGVEAYHNALKLSR